jgi:hypothetical protein
VAPFQLMTYFEARQWGKVIRDQVARREMPPWLADPSVGEFANDPRLSEREIAIVTGWVDAGMPAGRGQDMPPMPKFPDWQIGAPDVVAGLAKPVTIPAVGSRFLVDQPVDITFDEDRYLERAEIIPGRRIHTHHATLSLNTGGQVSVLASYLPGGKVPALPPGTFKRIPKGSRLTLTMHYYPVGEVAVDADTRIGLTFAKGPVSQIAITGVSSSRAIDIAPNVATVEVRGAPFVFAEDSHIISLMPRMYQRGKDVTYTLTLPDGTSRVLLKTVRWEDDWQPSYLLKTPVAAPKGSTLVVLGRFDNTSGNENNPDPKQRIVYPNEVMDGFFEYTIDGGR